MELSLDTLVPKTSTHLHHHIKKLAQSDLKVKQLEPKSLGQLFLFGSKMFLDQNIIALFFIKNFLRSPIFFTKNIFVCRFFLSLLLNSALHCQNSDFTTNGDLEF